MSEETFIASDALIVPKLASLAFWYSCVPIFRWPVSVIVVRGLIRPSSSAASAVTGLNVEPVG